jgi:threonine/homoserine/homoserine lactone efflux protein
MDPNLEIVFSFILATASLALSPGPDNIFVLVQSMIYGKKQGIAIVLGLMSGCIIHTSLVAFGVSVFIRSNPQLYMGLKFCGAAYMLFLAYNVLQAPKEIKFDSKSHSSKPFMALFYQGFLMNVLNPKVSIFFLAFFPAFLFSTSISLMVQFYILGGLFILTSFTVFCSIVLMSDRLAKALKRYSNYGVLLQRFQFAVFLGIAALLLFF